MSRLGRDVLQGKSNRQAERKHTEEKTYWEKEAVGGLKDKSLREYDFTK